MSVTIASLDWLNNEKKPPSMLLTDQYGWMDGFSVYSGYKGKTMIHDFALSAPVLKAYNCLVDVNDITLNAKEVDIVPFRFTIPVRRCDYNQTWLAQFSNNIEESFLEDLQRYVYNQIGSELRTTILGQTFYEAATDADVVKVSASNVSSPVNAYNAITKFIQDLPLDFLGRAVGKETDDPYQLFVSPECYSYASIHLSGNGVAESPILYIGGFELRPSDGLTDGQMGVTYLSNLMIIFDDENDVNDFKVTSKEELGLDYISGGVAVVGSYQYAERIVMTDNFI